MSRADDAEFAKLYRQQYPALVTCAVARGVDRSDAEDAAQTVVTRMLAHTTEVQNPRAYLYRAVLNEGAALARRQRGDLSTALRWANSQVERCAAEDVYHRGEVGIVLDSLAILPPRQREVMVRVYEGHPVSDIAEALGMPDATVRSNLRHGRNTLRPFFVGAGQHLLGDGQHLHRRAGQRLYEAWQRGDTLPAAPRPVIGWAWARAKALGVDPEHGATVMPLGRDEVQRRRRESPLAACSWALDALAELGKATGQMRVVVDADGVVLWRGGERKVLRRADEVGCVEGACWDLEHSGANGIALALTTGRTARVCGWEHYVQAQHDLSCVAAPVRDPQDGRVLCVLNLTATRPTVHHALLREIDALAMRLHRQLRREQPARPRRTGCLHSRPAIR
ncbi:MAG: sigma-70 family RNA polymerase sigma factor [Pseudonocardiaceae bacterium]